MNNKNILLRSKIVSGWSYFVLILPSALTELSSWRLDVFLLCIRLCAHPKPKRPTSTTLLKTMEVKFLVLHWENYSSHFAICTWRDMGRKFSTESAPIALYLSFGARKLFVVVSDFPLCYDKGRMGRRAPIGHTLFSVLLDVRIWEWFKDSLRLMNQGIGLKNWSCLGSNENYQSFFRSQQGVSSLQ